MRDFQNSTDTYYELAIPFKEFDVVLSDITEEVLIKIGHHNEIEHFTSPSNFVSPAFPVSGCIHGLNNRLMIPLVCQPAGKKDLKAMLVWFFVDTASPFTCLTVKSLEAFFGSGKATRSLYSFSIQDQESNIECQVSKGNFKFVNILGANAMENLKLSIDVDWKKNMFKLIKQ